MADAGIAVHGNYQDVTFAACTFQVADVADVQSVEAAVRQDQLCARAPALLEKFAEAFARDNFG
jgi:hypothetical protein